VGAAADEIVGDLAVLGGTAGGANPVDLGDLHLSALGIAGAHLPIAAI
jgi:hypothetical protein